MNGGKSDASTSTDDVKDRPLCLFYFTHPFGVLSPEPPTVTAAPPSLARAFLNMEPISPFYWPGSTGTGTVDESYRSTSPSTINYDLGDTTVHRQPVSVRTGCCTVHLPRRDSSTLSSTLFASDADAWFPSSGSSRLEFPRRAPYTRILPPLRLPSPKDLTDYTSDDIWPRKCLNKFSLPPIELPPVGVMLVRSNRREDPSSMESVGSVKEVRCGRKLGVSKARRRRMRGRGRGHDVRRMVGCLMRRAIRAAGRGRSREESRASPAPALQLALSTIREAWTEPTSLNHRCRVLRRVYAQNSPLEPENTTERDSERESDASASAMMTRPQLTELQPRPDASPGLMRRRYSVPETIMRKYRLAQQNSDSEECGALDGGSLTPACGACPSPPRDTPRSAGESPRHLRRDRELMRKSALLRRLWARPPAPPASPPGCRCETRSLDELRAEPRPERKRQRRRAPSVADPTCAALSSCADSADARAAADSTAPASPEDSAALSTSASTAQETPGSMEFASSIERHFEGRVSARGPSVENEDRNATPSPLARPYEVLEVVVSESASSSPPEGERLPPSSGPIAPRRPPRDMSLDEYVSRVLVESLNSLSDRLEGVTAGIGTDRKLSVVEKEIKVRLQNAAVNTIVHLSPTSNNQIIFGNEELCDEEQEFESDLRNAQHRGPPRDECNNPRAPSSLEVNNNASPSASPSPTPTPTPRVSCFDAVIQHDNVNRAVLQQIQKLFRDELRHEHRESGDDVGAVSHIDISSVDAFLSGGAGADTISVMTSDAGSPVAGVGAGNYFRDLELALVPRRCAAPHSASMEVNASSSEDALASDATSLVDSLDDPQSPRAALLRRRARPALARSAVDVLDLLPDPAPPPPPPPPRDRSAAFFVRIRDDAAEGERARVAECMPERIRQKLHRRHRKRELRMECARRGKVRQLRDELERRRAAEQARAERALERDAAALADSLLADLIAGVARDECRLERARPHREPPAPAPAPERRRSDAADERARRPERHQLRGRPVARPPRRVYQKSEIREGDKCIEILEILEYSAASRSSPETTPTDDSAERARTRRSRIPVPVPPGDRMRLTGGDGRAAPPLAELLLRALAPPARAPAPPEPRSRSNSLRFKRVFDMIPEERGGPGGDSPSPELPGEGARRASTPSAGSPPAPAPAPAPPRRSAGTSPPAPGEARRQRSQTTMTSPSSRSAATSPWRAPPPRPPPPREGIVCALRPTLHRTASLAVEFEGEMSRREPREGRARAPLGADSERQGVERDSRRRRRREDAAGGGDARGAGEARLGGRVGRLQLQRSVGGLAAVLAGAALAVCARAPATPAASRAAPRAPLPRPRRRLVGDGGGLVPRRAARRRGDAATFPARAPRGPHWATPGVRVRCVRRPRPRPRPRPAPRAAPLATGPPHAHYEEGSSRLFDSCNKEYEEVNGAAAGPRDLPRLSHQAQELREDAARVLPALLAARRRARAHQGK